MDARILDGCDCDGDFEFTDVIFTIFWMPLAWRPRILFRCLWLGPSLVRFWDYFDNSFIFWFCRAMVAHGDVTPVVVGPTMV